MPTKPLTKREDAAFNDGKNACRQGHSIASCKRKGAQRTAWLLGYAEQHRFQTAKTVSDADIAEAKRVLANLKEHVRVLCLG